ALRSERSRLAAGQSAFLQQLGGDEEDLGSVENRTVAARLGSASDFGSRCLGASQKRHYKERRIPNRRSLVCSERLLHQQDGAAALDFARDLAVHVSRHA